MKSIILKLVQLQLFTASGYFATVLLPTKGHCLLWASSQLPTRQKPCHKGGDDGRLPLADTCQKREEQTIASHSKDNAWKWKHGAEETKPRMKEEGGGKGGGGGGGGRGGGGRGIFNLKTSLRVRFNTRPQLQPFSARYPDNKLKMLCLGSVSFVPVITN